MAVIGGGITIGLFGTAALKVMQASEWPSASCKVLHSELERHSSDDGTTYSIDILFEYTYEGRTYQSNTYNFLNMSSSGTKGKRRVLQKYKAGSSSTCYVNPKAPHEAVLNRGFTKLYLVAIFPGLFAVGGVWGIIWMMFFRKEKKGYVTRTAEFATEDDKPLVLARAVSPVKRFIGIGIFCLIWNGIVVFLITLFFKEKSYAILFFAGVFGIFGILILAGTIKALLQIFNPIPYFRIKPGLPACGHEVRLQWRMKGAVNRLAHLKVSFEGLEEAKYTVGTDTRTDTHVFHTEIILESDDPREMSQGETVICLPASCMHTFRSSHNRIFWRLNVHGDIPNWPDIEEQFEIEVVPV